MADPIPDGMISTLSRENIDDSPAMTLEQKHKRERKELQAKIQALKKSVAKGDKKRKKDVTHEIAQLEADLDRRHQEEIATFQLNHRGEESEEWDDAAVRAITQETIQLSVQDGSREEGGSKKLSRQQLRKQRKNNEIENMRREALEESEKQVNWKQIEDEAIRDLLNAQNLKLHEVAPDGHCLYNAIAHQVNVKNGDSNMSFKEARSLAAQTMLRNPQDYLPFAATEKEDEIMTEETFKLYCSKIESSAEWGGQLEIQALSRALQMPIHIIQMGTPTLKIGDEYENKEPIYLSFVLGNR